MELPRLEPLWQKYREQGLAVVAVERMHATEAAKKLIAEKGLTYHLLEDAKDGAVVRGRFGVGSFPTSFLIDRDGKIVYVHRGFTEGDEVELEEQIVELLGHSRSAER